MNTGVFIVPTGIGASIGGFAGDASSAARMFASEFQLIVNPNVVNAGCFSGLTPNMLYVEGFAIDRFFKNKLNLTPVYKKNKIGVVFDKSIPQEVLNVHINTINAVKTVYGCDIIGYDITDKECETGFYVNSANVSTGTVKNISALIDSSKRLIKRGAETIAVVCRFGDGDFDDYANGNGVDPVGGLEAVISHYIVRELKVPCAHSPAFDDISISTRLVDPRCSAEYITPTYLPCVLLGLSAAPLFSFNGSGLSVDDVKFLIVPYGCLGSIPVFEALKRGIDVYCVRENKTVLDVMLPDKRINIIETYEELFKTLKTRFIV